MIIVAVSKDGSCTIEPIESTVIFRTICCTVCMEEVGVRRAAQKINKEEWTGLTKMSRISKTKTVIIPKVTNFCCLAL